MRKCLQIQSPKIRILDTIATYVFNWRANRALNGEVDGKLRIVYPYEVYICVPHIHNPGVHGKFYGLGVKKEMIVLENKPWRSLD